MVAEVASVTGLRDDPNPQYSAELNALAPQEVKEEIQEEVMVAEAAVFTGTGDNPNPEFTARLDAMATDDDGENLEHILGEWVLLFFKFYDHSRIWPILEKKYVFI